MAQFGDGLGITETKYVQLFDADNPLELVNGERLDEIVVAYETYGTLNADASNAVFVCHALTGDAHAAGWHEGDKRPGWWDVMIGPGKPIDTDKFFVIADNLLGGCSGTTGPSSINPATGKPWGLDFPLLDMRDFNVVHQALLAHLGIEKLYALVGGSMGGMQTLQWALDAPEQLHKAVIIASSAQLTAQNIAFSAVGRQAIMRDEHFHDGYFQSQGQNPDVGLAIARMMAHITYTSEEGFEAKFGRNPQRDEWHHGFGVDFAVEGYLEHQGEVFLGRFDALSYLYLTRVMDYFNPFAEPDCLDRLVDDPVRFLVVSFDSDWRFSTEASRRITRQLSRADQPVSFRDIRSPWGHDSFLLQVDDYLATVQAFMNSDTEYRHTNWER